MNEPTITFYTTAPADSPETKGTTCYFKPEVLKWRVTSESIFLNVSGPATRVKWRRGEKNYAVKTRIWPCEVPPWCPIPTELLAEAQAMALQLEVLIAHQELAS